LASLPSGTFPISQTPASATSAARSAPAITSAINWKLEVVRDAGELGDDSWRAYLERVQTRIDTFVKEALLYIFCFRWRDLTTAAIDGDTADQVDELEPGQTLVGLKERVDV
jgi:hypothetical protein